MNPEKEKSLDLVVKFLSGTRGKNLVFQVTAHGILETIKGKLTKAVISQVCALLLLENVWMGLVSTPISTFGLDYKGNSYLQWE